MRRWHPLTGLADPSGATKSRPSLAVKIDNAPEARPQSGLDVADVVYEEVVEGGVTRFIAIFHSSAPALAGPVRSVRPMDPDILSAYHGLFAYSGGIPAFVSLMRKAPVQDVNVDVATDAYSWDKARRAPHNTFISPEKLWPKAKGDNADPPQAMFDFRAGGRALRRRRRPPRLDPLLAPGQRHLRLGRRLRHLEAGVRTARPTWPPPAPRSPPRTW